MDEKEMQQALINYWNNHVGVTAPFAIIVFFLIIALILASILTCVLG